MSSLHKLVPWHASLTFRFAAVLACLMVLSVMLRQPLVGLVYALTGLPTERIAQKLDFAAFTAQGLLLDAETGPDGELLANEVRRERTEGLLGLRGDAFLLLDVDGNVVSCSRSLEPHARVRWEVGNPDHEPVDLERRCPGISTDERASTHAYYTPLRDDNRALGTFVLLVDEAPRSTAISASSFATLPAPATAFSLSSGSASTALVPERVIEARAWRRGIATVLEWVIPMAVVMLLSIAIARFVTRRLKALSLATTPCNAESLPGPFPDRGKDEIAVLGVALNSMRDHVRALLAERDRRVREDRAWVAQVSHDLRTPLTALLACLDRAAGAKGDNLAELLEVARLDAMRVNDLAEGLLEIARLDSGEQLRTERLHADALVGQVSRALGPLAAAQHRELVVDLAPDMPLVEADGQRLLRVLENLVRNGLQHARERVTMSVGRNGCGGVAVMVSDDGPGFGGEAGKVDLDSIARNGAGSGMAFGIGLQVARRIVTAHGSRLLAENPAAGGARVGFVLQPASDSA